MPFQGMGFTVDNVFVTFGGFCVQSVGVLGWEFRVYGCFRHAFSLRVQKRENGVLSNEIPMMFYVLLRLRASVA